MNFADLYRYANATLTGNNIPFKMIRNHIIQAHPNVGAVELWPVPLNEEISIGYMKYEEDRTSPYADPFDVAVIRYSEKLNRCWTRLVCCKELMHIFDTTRGRTNSRERFLKLLAELETQPVPKDASEMLSAERQGLWMALLVLCPERLRRQHIKANMNATEIAAAAQALKIPVQAIRPIASEYYLISLENLTGDIP